MHTQNVNVKTAAQESSRKMGGNFNSELPPLRGLTTRIAWGQAKVLRLIDADKAASEMMDVLTGAQLDGHDDFSVGEYLPPGMFSDSPELVEAWMSGWSLAASVAESEECSCCNDLTGEPCPYHG